jgi:hypothetical protein
MAEVNGAFQSGKLSAASWSVTTMKFHVFKVIIIIIILQLLDYYLLIEDNLSTSNNYWHVRIRK